VSATRRLLVIADDLGIGPATSRGILELAGEGLLSGAVLLVNSPYTEEAVADWKRRGRPVRLGWHACLTLDRPVLPARRVPSLVGPDGRFHPLGTFLARLARGRIERGEVAAELAAQYGRFCDLAGRPPAFVNGHQHVHVFPGVGAALRRTLARQSPRPFVRRVVEPVGQWLGVPGARLKRAFLAALGARAAARQAGEGFPGADALAGVTDPPCTEAADYFTRWLAGAVGDVVELMVHPGHLDETLIGRDCTRDDGRLQRRVNELRLLRQPAFREACEAAGFVIVPPGSQARRPLRGGAHAA
jgi:predicted glycoside hydrolase/deacetylase ChbG (UPF0249 family)